MNDAAFFDRVARLYDLASPSTDAGAIATGLHHARRPVTRIVDLGGGTGRGADAVAVSSGRDELTDDADAERAPLGVVVVDAARNMLARARGHGHETAVGDAGRLPIRDGGVDAVVILDALHHFPRPEAAIRESARALAPGGVLVIREYDPTTLPGRLLVAAERLVGFDSTFFTPGRTAELLGDAGLDVAVPERGFDYTVVGVRPEPGPS